MNKKIIKVSVSGNNDFVNYRPALCWCGQLKNTTHVCDAGLPKTEIYEYKRTEVKGGRKL